MADIAVVVEADMLSASPSDAAVGYQCAPAGATPGGSASRTPPPGPLTPLARSTRADGDLAGEAIAAGACEVAATIGAAAIVTATVSGFMARAVARHRPPSPSSPSAPGCGPSASSP